MVKKVKKTKHLTLVEPVVDHGPDADNAEMNLLDLVHHCYKRFVVAQPHYHVALSLWAMHTHIYRRFDVTPRLAVLSPIINSGKTTTMKMVKVFANSPEDLTIPTAPNLFRMTDEGSTILIDEADNLQMTSDLCAVLNQGHKTGTVVSRMNPQRECIRYSLSAPLAIAGVGKLYPALLSRAVIIQLKRATPQELAQVEIFNENNLELKVRFDQVKILVAEWARDAWLNSLPVMPIKGRPADKWRPLIAIADWFGHGELARKAMMQIIGEFEQTDLNELLLHSSKKYSTPSRPKCSLLMCWSMKC